jgi:hypothetical protein
MEFHIGDKVRLGTHVCAITDVGTALIQVQTTEGDLRVVCPWELVKDSRRRSPPDLGGAR